MAEEPPDADPDALDTPEPAGDQDVGASVRRFVTIFLFILALFVIFDPELRDAMGNAVGVVLGPLFAFNHQYPVLTFFPVAIVMVLATSAIRHVMMDWQEMAKVQHLTSHLNKELFKATKNDNRYKIKKLNELKESERFAELQSKQMGSTWKVMGPTMLIAVAIFAWMFSFAAAPVAFTVDAPDGGTMLVWDGNLAHARTLDGGAEVMIGQSADIYVFADRRTTVETVRGWDGTRFVGSGLGPFPVEDGREIDLEPGTYRVRTIAEDSDLTAAGADLVFPVIAVQGPDGMTVQKVWPAGDDAPTIEVPANATVTGLIPAKFGPAEAGITRIELEPVETTGGESQATRIDLTEEHVHVLPGATTHVIAKTGRVPWAEFDLNGTTLLPNWILLYSLFTIPFGYLFQKVFKAWEYRDRIDDTAGG